MSESEPKIVVTGTAWMGVGIGSIESALDQIFKEVKDEVIMTVYTIGSGADSIFNWLENALNRGIRIRLIINNLVNQPDDVVDRLKTLNSSYRHFELYDYSGSGDSSLHAKAIVADHQVALIGSSNMSKRGLLANHELAVVERGSTASTAGIAMERLLNSPLVRRV